jgi:hypothetical protein
MCCGHPTVKSKRVLDPLPPNPRVLRGVALLYLGVGSKQYVGPVSGLRFHVSERRRDFVVPTEDAPDLAKRRDLILAPS